MDNHEAGRLQEILLRGDREAAKLLARMRIPQMISEKNRVLSLLTDRYREGAVPFCQLTAACQAAAVFHDDKMPPVACCGAVYGNTSPTGCNYMMMLLRGWGMPVLSLGTDVPADGFLDAVRQYHLRFAVCVVFSEADVPAVIRLHEQAMAEGLRNQFALLMTGISPGRLKGSLPVDFEEYSAAAVAGWMVDAWQR
jgi:methanogenic corrinoid protein MtbC1